ncbi:unnamed protein product, partial [Prorocentrum cordatum]
QEPRRLKGGEGGSWCHGPGASRGCGGMGDPTVLRESSLEELPGPPEEAALPAALPGDPAPARGGGAPPPEKKKPLPVALPPLEEVALPPARGDEPRPPPGPPPPAEECPRGGGPVSPRVREEPGGPGEARGGPEDRPCVRGV